MSYESNRFSRNQGENRTRKKDAIRSRDFLRSLIDDKIIYVHLGKMGKWGRPLIEVYSRKRFGDNINDLMLTNNMAVPYDGGKKLDMYSPQPPQPSMYPMT